MFPHYKIVHEECFNCTQYGCLVFAYPLGELVTKFTTFMGDGLEEIFCDNQCMNNYFRSLEKLKMFHFKFNSSPYSYHLSRP